MSLIFSEEQEMIADMAAKFAADKLAPHNLGYNKHYLNLGIARK